MNAAAYGLIGYRRDDSLSLVEAAYSLRVLCLKYRRSVATRRQT
jgi:hypothetical protein